MKFINLTQTKYENWLKKLENEDKLVYFSEADKEHLKKLLSEGVSDKAIRTFINQVVDRELNKANWFDADDLPNSNTNYELENTPTN